MLILGADRMRNPPLHDGGIGGGVEGRRGTRKDGVDESIMLLRWCALRCRSKLSENALSLGNYREKKRAWGESTVSIIATITVDQCGSIFCEASTAQGKWNCQTNLLSSFAGATTIGGGSYLTSSALTAKWTKRRACGSGVPAFISAVTCDERAKIVPPVLIIALFMMRTEKFSC